MQAQAKAHDVLRKASAAVAALDQRAADVTSVAADVQGDAGPQLARTVAALKRNVAKIEACLEVCLPILVLRFLASLCRVSLADNRSRCCVICECCFCPRRSLCDAHELSLIHI